jgi:hypothetical protein
MRSDVAHLPFPSSPFFISFTSAHSRLPSSPPDATSNHLDLRLQFDNQLISFVIPIGLDNPDDQPVRLGIESSKHEISYALMEGSVEMGKSTTGCWDVGEYAIRSCLIFLFFSSMLPR